MKKFRKAFLITIVSLSVLLCLFSCKKEEKATANVASTSAPATVAAPVENKAASSDSPSAIKNETTLVTASTPVVTASTPVVAASTPVVAVETPVSAVTEPVVEKTPEVVQVEVVEFVAENETEVVEEAIEIEDYANVVFVEPSFNMGTLSFNEDGSITDYYRYGFAIQAKVTVGDDYLEIQYVPATITGDDIMAFINACANAFPGLAEQVTYELTADSILFQFPEELMGNAFYKLTTLSYMNDVINQILENANHADAVYMSVDQNEVKTFATEFVLFGQKGSIIASNTSATIVSERPYTTEELEMIVGVCLAVNSDLQYAEYKIEGNTMTVSYPEVSDMYIKNVVSSINNLIKAYTPAPLPLMEEFGPVADEPVFAEAPVVETESVVEETTAVEEPKIEESVSMPVVTIVEAPVDVVAPATKAGQKLAYNTKLGITGGLTNLKDFGSMDFGLLVEGEVALNEKLAVGVKTGVTFDNGIPFIPYVKGVFGNAYVQAGAGFTMKFQDANRFKKVIEVAVGYEFPLEDAFSVFVEGGLRLTQYGSKTFVGGFTTVGGNIKF